MTANRGDEYDPLEDSDFDNMDEDIEEEEEEEEWYEENENMVVEEEKEPGPSNFFSSHDPENEGTIDNDDDCYGDVPEDEDTLWTVKDRRLAGERGVMI
ncbi:hypothetical protein BGZ96_008373 [Linnemannia gamsii]|uniref:Uncharacterized protein n=1 Tax=Linnemannia gamsii TaxID=64522 RepID=A0ABQ7JYL0_9FUNG|nr:hypothetical protein BGZ96_008373 [Linnemannia gamsii]